MSIPTYAAHFRCIGPECEDTCCRGWPIPLDRATYARYRQFPLEPLGKAVLLHITPVLPAQQAESRFAQIDLARSGFCPFFSAERLCSIQQTYGAQLLSTTCSVYPRALNRVNGRIEGSLVLSCPEAARLVLLNPDLLSFQGDLASGPFRTDFIIGFDTERRRTEQLRSGQPEAEPAETMSEIPAKPYEAFHAIRLLILCMIQDRRRPIWQRLILIGSLCLRLHEVSSADAQAEIPAILQEHQMAVDGNLLRDELQAWPRQPELKLRIVWKLSQERASDKGSGRRFQDAFWLFVEGLTSPDSAEPGTDDVPISITDVDRYLAADDRHWQPFLGSRPYVLENYLLNYVFSNLFPFGRESSLGKAPRSLFDEYLLLVAQFAWLEALLIGVAARHREQFSEAHLVHVVQCFSRAVEHDPFVRNSLIELIRQLKMDNLQGAAVLLRQ